MDPADLFLLVRRQCNFHPLQLTPLYIDCHCWMWLENVPFGHYASCCLNCVFWCKHCAFSSLWWVAFCLRFHFLPLSLSISHSVAVSSCVPSEFHPIRGSGVLLLWLRVLARCWSYLHLLHQSMFLLLSSLLLHRGTWFIAWWKVSCKHCVFPLVCLDLGLQTLSKVLFRLVCALGGQVVCWWLLWVSLVCGLLLLFAWVEYCCLFMLARDFLSPGSMSATLATIATIFSCWNESRVLFAVVSLIGTHLCSIVLCLVGPVLG